MMPALLAIDAGGTSTRCVALTHDGRAVGLARVGASNPVSSGLGVAVASLTAAVEGALGEAGIAPREVRSVTIAMAGISTGAPIDLELQAALRARGVSAPVRLESDAEAAFSSGTAARSGTVLISGTGAAALRIDGGRTVATADGLGWLLGDVGSGFWIGRRIARAVLADMDGRGPATALTGLLHVELGLEEGGARRPDDGRPEQLMQILTSVYADAPVRIARFAPLAFVAHERDRDDVATAIVDAAADGLHATIRAVMGSASGPIVVSGGILSNQPALRRRIEERLRADGHPQRLITVEDGLTGAAVLALRSVGVEVDEHARERLQAEIAGLRAAHRGS